ncbi:MULTISPECIES: hypothetical protein [unclassified Variovorax]|uniref:hypothetical protein n=1 Tax=unclassified Variovorax TaxID=663243 RepID=UPI00131822BA|nr:MULTISPECIES: hypothetical protein [unclassified Variovorax]VTU18809.1 hypothetical protein SRS16CHR_02307 [Variovorax sp. SRS16]VTU27011.1 hypothetical protein E5CHR_02313 [Variovorax sp. PBL-E5]
MSPTLPRRLLIVSLLPILALAACSARDKEAQAKEIDRCRAQVKDFPDPTQQDAKRRFCAKLEFDYRNKYESQPDPR